MHPKIYVALPVMAESQWLPACLDCISKQVYQNYTIVACVNQPESFRQNENKKYICDDNTICLELLTRIDNKKTSVIDHSSQGKGWTKKSGIGHARKVIMDKISTMADSTDHIISLDADTTFNENYFSSAAECFEKYPDATALSNPYYHKLTTSENEDRAVLRYEIYMRSYAINLLYIQSPYAFTALGSAISLPVSAYRAIGGMTPKLSGEDFYFLQKLKKFGKVIIHSKEKVFPAARFSDRVFFGTGPAMIKGNSGDWNSYPVYHHSIFADIKKTYDTFPLLFEKTVETPMTGFLAEQFSEKDIWQPLRKNFNSVKMFERACHEKVDGLRILQYLKQKQPSLEMTDECCLAENIKEIFSKIVPCSMNFPNRKMDFRKCTVKELNAIRNYLVEVEEILQKRIMLL